MILYRDGTESVPDLLPHMLNRLPFEKGIYFFFIKTSPFLFGSNSSIFIFKQFIFCSIKTYIHIIWWRDKFRMNPDLPQTLTFANKGSVSNYVCPERPSLLIGIYMYIITVQYSVCRRAGHYNNNILVERQFQNDDNNI